MAEARREHIFQCSGDEEVLYRHREQEIYS